MDVLEGAKWQLDLKHNDNTIAVIILFGFSKMLQQIKNVVNFILGLENWVDIASQKTGNGLC